MITILTFIIPYAALVSQRTLDITYLTSELIFTHMQSWCDLFGYEASKVIGQTCKILQGKDTEMDRIAEIMTGVKVIHNNFSLPFPLLCVTVKLPHQFIIFMSSIIVLI